MSNETKQKLAYFLERKGVARGYQIGLMESFAQGYAVLTGSTKFCNKKLFERSFPNMLKVMKDQLSQKGLLE